VLDKKTRAERNETMARDKSNALLPFLCPRFLWHHRMIRHSLHLGFIHSLRAFSRVGSTCGNHPVFGGLGARVACTSLDAAGVNSQLRFATGDGRLDPIGHPRKIAGPIR
jgi:hypothetical protein